MITHPKWAIRPVRRRLGRSSEARPVTKAQAISPSVLMLIAMIACCCGCALTDAQPLSPVVYNRCTDLGSNRTLCLIPELRSCNTANASAICRGVNSGCAYCSDGSGSGSCVDFNLCTNITSPALCTAQPPTAAFEADSASTHGPHAACPLTPGTGTDDGGGSSTPNPLFLLILLGPIACALIVCNRRSSETQTVADRAAAIAASRAQVYDDAALAVVSNNPDLARAIAVTSGSSSSPPQLPPQQLPPSSLHLTSLSGAYDGEAEPEIDPRDAHLQMMAARTAALTAGRTADSQSSKSSSPLVTATAVPSGLSGLAPPQQFGGLLPPPGLPTGAGLFLSPPALSLPPPSGAPQSTPVAPVSLLPPPPLVLRHTSAESVSSTGSGSGSGRIAAPSPSLSKPADSAALLVRPESS